MIGAYFTLVFVHAGAEYRLATDAVEGYVPGLGDVTVQAGATSVALAVYVEPPGGWAGTLARWPLEGSRAVLTYHPGDGSAHAVIEGYLTGAAWGPPGDPLAVTIEVGDLVDDELIPRATHVLGPETWGSSNYETEREGQYYPVVIGKPGYTPAVFVQNPTPPVGKWVIAGHEVAASEVYFLKAADVYQGETGVPTYAERDEVGNPVATVREGDLSVITPGVGDAAEYYAGWKDSEGGLLRLDRTGAVTGAGEVIRRLLGGWSSIRVDGAKWAQHEAWLNQYRVDTYLDTPTAAWEWVQQSILSMIPHRVRRSSEGLWIQPVRWDATPALAVARFTEGVEVTRVGGCRLWSPPFNAWSAQYGYELGRYRFTASITAENGALRRGPAQPDNRVLGDYRCALSASRFGVRWGEPVVLDHTADPATAYRVLQDRARELAIPHRVVTYSAPVGPLARLGPGDVVALVDEGLHIDTVALVDSVTLSVDEIRITVVALDGPLG